jgi:hypothetical protein
MADLTGINIDANVPESGSFTIIPPATYKAVIAGDKITTTKDGRGKMLELTVQIIDGPYTGSTIIDRLNIVNASQQAQNIAHGTLKRICNCLRVPFPPQKTDALMGKPLMISVGVEEFTSNTSGNTLQSNKIKNYSPVPQVTATQQAQPSEVKGW